MERFDSPMRPVTPPDHVTPNHQTVSARSHPRSRARSQFNSTGSQEAAPSHLDVSTALVPVLFGVLLLWNWRVALALLAGSFTMNAAFALQSPLWQRRLKQARQGLGLFAGNSPPMLLAVTGGMVATLGTYTGISMWMAAGERWLTLGAIAQGLVSFGILCLLAVRTWQQPVRNAAESFDRALQEIAATDSLVRLLGVRKLHQFLTSGRSTPQQQRFACDCLKLALQKESEPKVRERLLQTLQLCGEGADNG